MDPDPGRRPLHPGAARRAPLTGGGEDGIFAVHDCGGQAVLRWFSVHDGFGLFAALIVAPDADQEAAQAHFAQHIGELVWSE